MTHSRPWRACGDDLYVRIMIHSPSHSPSVISGISTVKPSQAMGAVMREPREGEIPVEPTAIGRLMTSQ